MGNMNDSGKYIYADFDNCSSDYQNASIYIKSIISSVTFITCCVGLPLNGMVIWLLSFQIRRNPFAVLILNLAIADFGVLVFTGIYSFCMIAFEQFGIIEGLVIFYLFHILYINSLFLLTAISIDRCVAVLFPFWYHSSRPKYLSPAVCAFLWICSFLLVEISRNMKNLVFSFTLWDLDLLVAAVFCLPLITISTVILFIKMCLKSEQVKRGRLLAMVSITLLCFLILTLPLYIYVFTTHFLGMYCLTDFQFFLYFDLSACLNSSVNPVIYFLIGRKKQIVSRESIKVIFQGIFREDEAPETRYVFANTVSSPV